MRDSGNINVSSVGASETVRSAPLIGGPRSGIAVALPRVHQRVRSLAFLIPAAAFAAQLGLLALVIRQFRLESVAFFQVTLLSFAGFFIHAMLPLRFRMTFFLALSLAAVCLVFGLGAGLTLIGLGLVLVGICHLPVRVSLRLLLLLGVGISFALLRIQAIPSAVPTAVWPILGSMFMFRLWVYFYDLQTEKAPLSLSKTLSYFFLLPNVCFPLFPVVDYKTFRRTYYNEDAARIYQKGIHWILRGVVHLLLYRLVYYRLVIAPSQVSDLLDLVRYLLANFLLYLRVSGQFHIAIGMLHLFGFNLPETHHLYYLASGFIDFWRRINIYWKDFMMKLVYYPVFFRLRKRGQTLALVVSTIVVFVSTWLLHSYQWFWLLGSFPLAWQDALFWGVLAVLVVIASLREMRPGKTREAIAFQSRTRVQQFSLVARTAGTFVAICILWSLWSSQSLSEWWDMWQLGAPTTSDLRWILILLTGLVICGVAARVASISRFGAWARDVRGSWSSVPATMLVLLVLAVLGYPPVSAAVGWPASSVLSSMKQTRLNSQDARLLERGYYQNLLSVDRFNSQLWELYTKRPAEAAFDLDDTPVVRLTGDILKTELVPSQQILFKGSTFTTNRWGLRDGEYEKTRPEGTYRVALLGSSQVLGWGVADNETFENLVETRLNDQSTKRPHGRYEILNFAVDGYGPLEEFATLERKALPFEPNAVFYVAQPNDLRRAIGHLVERLKDGVDIPYEELQRFVSSKGVDKGTSEFLVGRLLEPHGNDLLQWIYRQIVTESRNRGILPVWIFVPTLNNADDNAGEDLERLAREAGFITITLTDVYDNHPQQSLWVSRWDDHPNARGHALIARKLLERLHQIDAAHGSPVFAATPVTTTRGVE